MSTEPLSTSNDEAFLASFNEAVSKDTSTEMVDAMSGINGDLEEVPETEVNVEEAMSVLDEEPEVEEVHEEVEVSSEVVEEETSEVVEDEQDEQEEGEQEEEEVDYQAQVDQMLEPIEVGDLKLNIESVDEARRLMQVGIEAQKKLADMQPKKKLLSMLEAKGLTDLNKLNHMIDLFDKKPEAIAKFLKDAEIDPMDIDTESSTEYSPEDHSPSDEAVVLDDILSEVKTTPTGEKMLSNIQKWDTKSVDFLVQNPQTLKLLNQHVASGIYDQVMSEISKRKIFGQVDGMADYELYHKVGTELAEKGAFDSKSAAKVDTKKITPLTSKETERKNQKKASKAPKGKPAQQTDVDRLFDLSDEDYLKVITKAIS